MYKSKIHNINSSLVRLFLHLEFDPSQSICKQKKKIKDFSLHKVEKKISQNFFNNSVKIFLVL